MQLDLEEAAQRLADSPRPVLTHLNADTTWLLSIPDPTYKSQPNPTGRSRFNILIDPWLRGPQVDQAGWFSKQWHAIESSVQHIADVEVLLRRAEGYAAIAEDTKSGAATIPSYIDAVIVSHEFTDHCHEPTLKEISAQVPVYATAKAAKLIRSWSHFDTVLDIPPFTEQIDWRTTTYAPLPAWLGISRLIDEKDALYYHSAVIVCIETTQAEAEAIIYTPHGVEATSFAAVASARPPVQTLALLHGLHDVSLRFTAQLNLGAHNALKAQRLLRAKYWVGTHDEVKKGSGVVSAWLRRKPYTLHDALTHEAANLKRVDGGDLLTQDVSFLDLANGKQLVLD